MRKWNKAVAAVLAVAAAVTLGQPMTVNALEDESTYENVVRVWDKEYYSSIHTNFHAGNVEGLVCRNTEQEMRQAVGITTQEQLDKGFEPVLFVDDWEWDSDERKLAEAAVQEMNGTLVTMLDIQLFRYEIESFEAVHDAARKVTLMAKLPDEANKDGNIYEVVKDDGREFAMVRVHNGQVSVLKDLDQEAWTLTFETDKFSVFGLMYAPAGEIDKYLSGSTQNAAGQNTSGQASGTTQESAQGSSSDDLDEVPKTGDILWEIEYGYYEE